MCLTLIGTPKDNERQSSDEGYAVFDGDRCVGHIMRARQAPAGRPWFWTIFAGNLRGMSDRGYAATQQQAMIALEAAWAEFKKLLTMRAQPGIGG